MWTGPSTRQGIDDADAERFDGESAEEREAIVNYFYERSGQAPPHTGGAAEDLSAEMAQSMIDAGQDEAPLAPDGGALELVVGTRAGLLMRVSTMAPTLWAVGGTFAAGFAIGTGVRKLFARFTGPDDVGTGGSPNWTWGSITWRPQGTEPWFGATVQQSPGAYLYDHRSSVVMWDEPPCPYSGFTAPPGARMQYAVASTGQCNDLLRDQLDWGLTPGSQPEEEPVRVGTRLSEEDRACKDHFAPLGHASVGLPAHRARARVGHGGRRTHGARACRRVADVVAPRPVQTVVRLRVRDPGPARRDAVHAACRRQLRRDRRVHRRAPHHHVVRGGGVMADARTLAALGLRDGAPDWAIAGCLRQLAGLPREAPGDASLWMRVLAAIDNAVRHGDEKVDLALFAHGIACHAVAPPGDPEEDRFGVQAWDREWGVRDAESDELLRMLAIERLAPRLWNARLVYIIDYV